MLISPTTANQKSKMKKLMTMKLPESDTHFLSDGYQMSAQKAAYGFCRQQRRAIDVGAHVGYWAKEMATRFARVEAFEPCPENFACLVVNAPAKVRVWNMALGEGVDRAMVMSDCDTNSGAKHIALGVGDTIVFPLDCFGFNDVDLIKIDTQGHEWPILLGAQFTIRRSFPVLVVEMPKEADDSHPIHNYVVGLGYKKREQVLDDWIYGDTS